MIHHLIVSEPCQAYFLVLVLWLVLGAFMIVGAARQGVKEGERPHD